VADILLPIRDLAIIKKLDYWRRLFFKPFCFFLFGIGAFLLGAIVYPIILVVVRDRVALRKASRRLVGGAFSLFVGLMRFLGLIQVEFENGEALRESRGFIIAANHPSLIDVVILASLIPQADCIVKQALWDTPLMRWIVRRSYIPNSLEFQKTAELCHASFAEGNSLIVFPEGTRTKEGELPRLRRGAARIALCTGRDILPVRISTSDARGLRKGDPFMCLSKEGPVRFSIRVMPPIRVEEYAALEPAIGARALTKHLSEAICIYPPMESVDG
jgi:1-acyl-sn-glycerol-3-phosphate acyltransferase